MKASESKIDFIRYSLTLYNYGHYAIPLNEINLYLKMSSLEDLKLVEVLLTIDNIEEKSKIEKKYIT